MIAVDTSALMAILQGEPQADICAQILGREDRVLISAGSATEALIVAGRRGIGEEMAKLMDGLGFEVVPVTRTSASRIAAAYARWGRGVHPAGLNFGDCFSYAVAEEHGCALLFVGDNFNKTDIASAL